jgi:IS605 OrfB family transposase
VRYRRWKTPREVIRALHPLGVVLKAGRWDLVASATFTRSGFSYRNGQIKLAKTDEPLAIAWSRPLPEGAQPSSVTVSRDAAGRWHTAILVEDQVSDGPATGAAVGMDAGITSLLTLSTGEKITNPKHEQADREKLAKAQRRLAKKEKGSANRAKARLKVARIHARIADRRRDHLHKLSTRIIRENQTVVIEDLAVRNLIRNRGLARAIGDAAWSQLRSMLEYVDAGVQGRLVRPDGHRDRPVLPVQQDLLRLRTDQHHHAAQRPGLDLPLRGRPRPRRQRGTQHLGRGARGVSLRRWRETSSRLAREGGSR